jgi:hypothetical protein
VEPVLIREWDNERFHRKVLELEANGYEARRETYQVIPEQNPDTGFVVHLYSIEMYPAENESKYK